MEKKKMLVMGSLLVAIVLLGIGTIAYFRRTVNGDITGQTGNLVLVVNEANAVDNETFSVRLKRSETEDFILPDDKGTFNLNIDSTGSSSDVGVTITISRTNLPDNLKFYLDETHTKELTKKTLTIKKSDNMRKTVPVYWFWDGSVDDENDSEFINKTISANISVTATIANLYNTLLSQPLTLDTNVDFTKGASETNGQGLMMMDATQTQEYPILYYRGDVSNNNVVFANKCWLIVRTTETGGTKLIYNGEVNADGSCTNYSGVGGVAANISSTDVFVGNTTTKFNPSSDSPVYVGYMYNDTNKFFTHSEGWTGATDATGTLDADSYAQHLVNNTIDSASSHHTQNLKDSTAKEVIDAWYLANIDGKPEESLLEDTVWCNARSVISENYSIENYARKWELYFAAKTRLVENTTTTPSLVCSRAMDKFTVEEANGNGDLTYPVGMLTADEILMAGNTISYGDLIITYLSIPNDVFWTLSPNSFTIGSASMFGVVDSGLSFQAAYVSNIGARPSVSLGLWATVSEGDGSFQKPFVVN